MASPHDIIEIIDDRREIFAWRLSNYETIDGVGGLRASGRWHTKPKPIVYCADALENAILEMERRLPRYLFPATYKAIKIRIPSTFTLATVRSDKLPINWHDDWKITQPVGDYWLSSLLSPVLLVPSVAHSGKNILLNPVDRKSDFLDIVEVRSL
ncbi:MULTISPECIES: RES family NAD+ phosphorylase [Aurantimonas]|uniref:RES family NAD+ phosphorylase n=1 Tax=Aurantimonas TaxID=182269 RepID=UPI0035166FA2